MDKSTYDKIMNAFFIVMAGLTFLCLYRNIVWLSLVLAILFAISMALHIRDYFKESPKRKKIFVLTIITLINFMLANAVVVVGNFVYPY